MEWCVFLVASAKLVRLVPTSRAALVVGALPLLLVATNGCSESERTIRTTTAEATNPPVAGVGATTPRTAAQDHGAKLDAHAAESALLSVWRSPSSTLEQRAEALEKWLPREPSNEYLVTLLGSGGVWARVHGLAAPPLPWTNGQISHETVDYSRLEFNTPTGTVALVFVRQPAGSSSGWRFDRAVVVHKPF